MNGNKLKLISLFCGCGGSTTGYVQSGFKPLMGVDNDSLCIDSYNLNHPSSIGLKKDVRSLTIEEIQNLTSIEIGELDLLDSSPPCQGFSITGSRKLLDERNDLIFEVIRLIDGLRPKTFIIENVDGMLKGKMRGYFNLILERLNSLDYRIKWKSLNGVYYGLPQKRQRVFFIGIRNDLNIEPMFPEHVQSFTYFDDVVSGVEYQNRGQFDKKWKTVKGNFCYTITKTPSLLFIENGKERQPTIEELKLLSSFPHDYKLSGNYHQQWGQIGNSVPPILTRCLGEKLQSFLN